jgi:SAM-dependent methyltransferase
MGAAYFEELYRASEDPWDLATSDYERRKYDTTIAALGDRPFASALEIGCSIGTLTERLAERCGAVLAVDCAATALERAGARVGHLPNVTVERRAIPDEMPAGRFDLIVCSEVLYYWDRDLLVDDCWPRLVAATAPGGALLAVHWRGAVRHYPQGGDAVHALIRKGAPGLTPARSEVHPGYLLDRFDVAA